MRFLLDIPAYYDRDNGEDMPGRTVTVCLPVLPREREQIFVHGGGIVEVANIRHAPIWDSPSSQAQRDLPGGRSESLADLPILFTSWARRPGEHIRG